MPGVEDGRQTIETAIAASRPAKSRAGMTDKTPEKVDGNERYWRWVETQKQDKLLTAIADAARQTPPKFLPGLLGLWEKYPHLKPHLTAARVWAEDFEAESESKAGLFISGPKGTGKTGIAYGVALMVAARGFQMRATLFDDLLLRIRSTYDDNRGENEYWIMRDFADVDLLLLDDIAATKMSEATIRVLFNLFDARYSHLKPMIVTCDLTIDALYDAVAEKNKDSAKRIVSRLREMTLAPENQIALTGRDLRFGKEKK